MEYAYEVGQQTADATAYNDEMVEYDDGIPYGHVLDEAGRLLKVRSEKNETVTQQYVLHTIHVLTYSWSTFLPLREFGARTILYS